MEGGLFSKAFTAKEARLAFMWSRMRWVCALKIRSGVHFIACLPALLQGLCPRLPPPLPSLPHPLPQVV